MSRHLNRFAPSVESLETRETPGSLSSVPAASSDSYYGTGVYKSADSGKTWTLAPDTASGRITGIATDPSDAIPTGSVRFIVDGVQVSTSDDGRKYKVLVTPLVLDVDGDGSQQVRPRTFALVDRTQLAGNDSIWLDISAPVQVADGSARFFNGIVSRISAGDTNETIIDGSRTEAQTTQSGNVYTVTFGGSLVG